MGAHIRRGQVTMVAGAPGGGKTALISHWARHVDWTGQGDGVAGIYFSADSDKMTFGKAAVANALNIHVNEAEKMLEAKDPKAFSALSKATDHMWITFQAAPSPRDIREEVDAFAYAYGDWPAWIVVDNLMDVDASGGGDDERSSQDAVIDFLKQLGRETQAAIVINLHVVGKYENGNEPIPLNGLMNKVSKRARLVLTLYQDEGMPNVLFVSVVKNSGGPKNTNGSFAAMVPWMPEMAWMGTEIR